MFGEPLLGSEQVDVHHRAVGLMPLKRDARQVAGSTSRPNVRSLDSPGFNPGTSSPS